MTRADGGPATGGGQSQRGDPARTHVDRGGRASSGREAGDPARTRATSGAADRSGRRGAQGDAGLCALIRLIRGPHLRVGSPACERINLVSFALTLVAGLSQGWALICLGQALGSLLGPGDSAWRHHLILAIGGAVAAALAHIATELTSRISAPAQEAAIRARALRHLFILGPGRSRDDRSGARVSLLTDGAERVALYRQTFLAPTAAAALSPALVLVLLAVTVDWLTAAVLVVAVAVIPLFILKVHGALRRSSSGSRRQRMRLSAEYLDAIQGLTTLTLARAAQRTLADLRDAGEDNRRAVMGLLAGNQLVILLTDGLFSLFFVTAAAGLALTRLAAGAISAGDGLAIMLVSYVLLEPLDRVGSFFYVGMGGLANQRALRGLLRTPRPGPTPPDSGRPEAAPPACAGEGPRAGQGAEVVLRSVRAGWGPREDSDVLTGIDLSIRPGERIAVTGPSGAGKSTLLHLISGDLLARSGTVRVDGTVLSATGQDRVRAASAVVAQSTWLFSGTIADNLRLADPGASRERMWRALETANLAEEVRRMPLGLDTVLGEQGLGLSGGQAQRVSLARAFLADRPLLILDEPTSQVDLDSEAQIIEAMERVARGRTVVTVTHRAGALLGADRLLRVADGRLVPDDSGPGHAPALPTAEDREG